MKIFNKAQILFLVAIVAAYFVPFTADAVSGSISSNSPCTLPSASGTCTVYVSWSSSNIEGYRIAVYAYTLTNGYTLWQEATSGSNQAWPYTTSSGNLLQLFAFSETDFPAGTSLPANSSGASPSPYLLGDISVVGTVPWGVISTNPYPFCSLEGASATCSVNVTWSSSGFGNDGPHAGVYAQLGSNAPVLFGCANSYPNQPFDYVPPPPNSATFYLKRINGSGCPSSISDPSVGATLASVSVFASLPSVTLSFSPTLSFSAVQGTSPASIMLNVTNQSTIYRAQDVVPADTLYTASQPTGWLSITPTSPATIYAGEYKSYTVSVSSASLAPGTYNASFRFSGYNVATTSVGVTLTVSPATTATSSAQLALEPASASVAVDGTVQFRSFYDPDGNGPVERQDVSGTAAWSSNNTSIAQSQGGGVFLGRAAGSVTVQATHVVGAVSYTATAGLTVTTNPVATLAIGESIFADIDRWQLSLMSSPAGSTGNKTVYICGRKDGGTATCTPAANLQSVYPIPPAISVSGSGTDANGNWSATGQFTSREVGRWEEWAYVGGTITAEGVVSGAIARSNTLAFRVYERIPFSITNLTVAARNPSFYVGDQWRLNLSPSPDAGNKTVYICGQQTTPTTTRPLACAPAPDAYPGLPALTSADGSWSGTGQMRTRDIGSWQEWIYVGGTLNGTDSLNGIRSDLVSFYVSEPGDEGGGCSATLVITPFTASVNVGATQQFTSIYDADGPCSGSAEQTVTTAATWSSSNTSVAASTATAGLFRGVASGYATIRATYSSLNAQATLNVTNVSNPDFSLSLNPSSLSIVRGSSGNTTLTVTGLNGFTGSVNLSVANLPAGVTTAFSRNPAAPGQNSTLTFTVGSDAAAGAYTVNVTGVSGSLTHAYPFSFTITATSTGPHAVIECDPIICQVFEGQTIRLLNKSTP